MTTLQLLYGPQTTRHIQLKYISFFLHYYYLPSFSFNSMVFQFILYTYLLAAYRIARIVKDTLLTIDGHDLVSRMPKPTSEKKRR